MRETVTLTFHSKYDPLTGDFARNQFCPPERSPLLSGRNNKRDPQVSLLAFWPFIFPVTRKEEPEYTAIVPNPIRIEHIKRYSRNRSYSTIDQFVEDFKLIR